MCGQVGWGECVCKQYRALSGASRGVADGSGVRPQGRSYRLGSRGVRARMRWGLVAEVVPKSPCHQTGSDSSV